MTSAIDKLPSEQRKTLENTANALTAVFNSDEWRFRLKAPEKLTVKIGGAYSKRPYIGDEKFIGNSAYVGKSGKVIVVLMDESNPAVLAEVPLNDALIRFGGMSELSLALQEYREDKAMGESRKEAEEFEHLAHVEAERARHTSNPAFGSW